MSKKQDEFYFQSFIECAEASCKAAKLLKDTRRTSARKPSVTGWKKCTK